MPWQELKRLRQATSEDRGFLKAVCESKNGEEYEVDVIKGAIDLNDLQAGAEALDNGEEVYLMVSFKRYPHPTKVKIGPWD